jgi:hypothetical protein
VLFSAELISNYLAADNKKISRRDVTRGNIESESELVDDKN